MPTPTWAGLSMPSATDRASTAARSSRPQAFLKGDVFADVAFWGSRIDTVIIAGGVNDLSQKNVKGAWISVEQVEAAIAEARSTAISAGKTVYVATLLPIRPALWFNDTTGRECSVTSTR